MKLRDLVIFNPTERLPSGGQVPFVDMAALPQMGRDIQGVAQREPASSGARFVNGDTLMARITPCLENGKGAQVRVLPDNAVGQGSTEFIVLRAIQRSDADFVYYVSRHPDFRNHAIRQMTGTSGRQRVAWQSMADYELPDVEPAQRMGIGSILGALDDKIELNRRINETLEAMARAIFKDWFVEFGPTRAKVEGRAPYLVAEIWSLFPDHLDADGKPEGWMSSTVGAEFDLTMGQSPPGETYNESGEGLPFFQGRTDFGFRYPIRRKYCSAPTRVAQPDDTLVSVRAPVGDLNMAWEKCCIGRGVAAVRHKSGKRGYTQYSLHALQPEIARFEDSGSVFGAINKAQFERLQVIAPTSPLIDAFEAIVEGMDDRIRANNGEAATLAATRDLLLPKLMSGEVRVKDAEKLAGEAT